MWRDLTPELFPQGVFDFVHAGLSDPWDEDGEDDGTRARLVRFPVDPVGTRAGACACEPPVEWRFEQPTVH